MTLPIDELIEKLNDWSRANDIFNYEREMFLDAASTLTSLQERNRKLEEDLTELRERLESVVISLQDGDEITAYGEAGKALGLVLGARALLLGAGG